MFYIHNSLNKNQFLEDKKLNLLRRGIITISQFINLIEKTDPYILIGPAVVDKTKIKEYLEEWKDGINNSQVISSETNQVVTQLDVIDKLNELSQAFPEVNSLIFEFQEKLKTTGCPKCTKNQYIFSIISAIRPLFGDGRYLDDSLKDFIEKMISRYYPIPGRAANVGNFSDFDTEWIKPDEFIGLGNDLIEGLDNCFNCVKKHIGRSKAFYEEFKLGYPQHEPLMFTELIKANKSLEEAYTYYSDSLAQLDMASCELVGNLTDLEDGWQVKIIELANLIRTERILFQDDPTKVPNWDKLRIEVQRLQNQINKLRKEENKEEAK